MNILKLSTESCSKCKLLATMLDKAGISYTEINLDDDANTEYISKYNVRSVPVLVLQNNGHDTVIRDWCEITDFVKHY